MEAFGKNGILVFIACFGFLVISSGSVSASSDWWNSNYQYRQQVTVTNNAGSVLESGYTVDMPLDITGLVGVGKAKANGDDIMVIFWDGASYGGIDRLLDIGGGKIAFATQADVNSSGSDANYWVYYGNPSAGAPPANGSNVYLLYDDFSDNQKHNNWVEGAGTWSIIGEAYVCSAVTGGGACWSTVVLDSGIDNMIFEANLQRTSDTSMGTASISILNSNGDFDEFSVRKEGGTPQYELRGNHGDIDEYNTAICNDQWYHLKLQIWDNNVTGWVYSPCGEDWEISRNDVITYYDIINVTLYSFQVTMKADNVKLRKYLSPEPTIILGGEEVTATIWEIVAALEEKIDILNATNQNQSAIIQEQETKIGLIDSTLNALKDFVKKIYDALPEGWKIKIGPWPF